MGDVTEMEECLGHVCCRCTIMVYVELRWDRDISAPDVDRLLPSCNIIDFDYGWIV